jgi:hypothetical protein
VPTFPYQFVSAAAFTVLLAASYLWSGAVAQPGLRSRSVVQLLSKKPPLKVA